MAPNGAVGSPRCKIAAVDGVEAIPKSTIEVAMKPATEIVATRLIEEDRQ